MNKEILQRFTDLSIPENKILITYVWIDKSDENLKSKTKTVDTDPKVPSDCSWWQFDCHCQETCDDEKSDLYLKPVALYKDPFRKGLNKIVLCETYDYDMAPAPTNNRNMCEEAMLKVKDAHPWFGVEQGFTFLDVDKHPLGWPKLGHPSPRDHYYCGTGAGKTFGRDILEAHYYACLYAGIKVYGTHARPMPAQWEYQIGPCEGIHMGDQLWMSRYILTRIAEEFGVIVSFDPKPIEGWNGTGAHTQFSTKPMREEEGIKEIEQAVDKLALKHESHIKMYDPKGGLDNKRRLDGKLDSSDIDKFTVGTDRNCSVRIPKQVVKERKGYFEDRRPASNCDPYSVTAAIVDTCLLSGDD